MTDCKYYAGCAVAFGISLLASVNLSLENLRYVMAILAFIFGVSAFIGARLGRKND